MADYTPLSRTASGAATGAILFQLGPYASTKIARLDCVLNPCHRQPDQFLVVTSTTVRVG